VGRIARPSGVPGRGADASDQPGVRSTSHRWGAAGIAAGPDADPDSARTKHRKKDSTRPPWYLLSPPTVREMAPAGLDQGASATCVIRSASLSAAWFRGGHPPSATAIRGRLCAIRDSATSGVSNHGRQKSGWFGCSGPGGRLREGRPRGKPQKSVGEPESLGRGGSPRVPSRKMYSLLHCATGYSTPLRLQAARRAKQTGRDSCLARSSPKWVQF